MNSINSEMEPLSQYPNSKSYWNPVIPGPCKHIWIHISIMAHIYHTRRTIEASDLNFSIALKGRRSSGCYKFLNSAFFLSILNRSKVKVRSSLPVALVMMVCHKTFIRFSTFCVLNMMFLIHISTRGM